VEARSALELAHHGDEFLTLGQHVDARRSFEAALVAAHNGLGVLDSNLGNVESAIEHYRDALRIDPNVADAESNLGYALAEFGDLPGAVRSFRRAIALDPRNPRYYRLLLLVQPDAIEASDIAALESLDRDAQDLTTRQQVELHFALGTIYASRGRVDESFMHFSAGNREMRRNLPYDESHSLRFMEALPKILRPGFIDELRAYGNLSERPIFVFGMPRSGTTLIAQILAAHPDVENAGELGIFAKIADETMPAIDARTSPGQAGPGIEELAHRYLAETDSFGRGRRHFVDKTLLNFHFAPLINAAFPNARLIFVCRDPLDTCWSCYTTLFADNLPFTYDLGELGRYYRAHETLMRWWRNALPPERFLAVQYEHVVDNLKSEARRLLEFCGLSWTEDCVNFHAAGGTVRTASLGQVRRPLYRGGVGSAERFRSHLGDLIAALG
jgi:hypothetical protein